MPDAIEFSNALDKVKVLDLSVNDFQKIFSHLMSFNRSEGNFSLKRKIKFNNSNVKIISAADVELVLDKKLRGLVEINELQEWANFVLMVDEYQISETESLDQQERIKNILHQVATPEVHNELTDAIIQYYLNCLRTKSDIEL